MANVIIYGFLITGDLSLLYVHMFVSRVLHTRH
jgi:hypothetical protein